MIYVAKQRQLKRDTVVNLHNIVGGIFLTPLFAVLMKDALDNMFNSKVYYFVESSIITGGIIKNKTPNTTDKMICGF